MFRDQARTRTMTLTDPTMTRFWLTIDHAVALVNHSLTRQTRGTILVDRMAATDMMTIANAAARMELGLAYDKDRIDFKIIGHRFGEKKHEELIAPEEVAHSVPMGQGLVEIHPVWTPALPPDPIDPMALYYTSATPNHWLTEEDAYEMMMKMELPW
jgi:FlaA1/EpsC-like NDP-sugar epimerase